MIRLAPLIFKITGLFHGLSFTVDDCFPVFLKYLLFCLLIGYVFANVVVMIPSFLMKNDLFAVDNLFAIFDADKAAALVFDLGSVKEATNTE